jgi:hypothetical protein
MAAINCEPLQCLGLQILKEVKIERQTERERQRQSQSERNTDIERERQRQRQRQRDRDIGSIDLQCISHIRHQIIGTVIAARVRPLCLCP